MEKEPNWSGSTVLTTGGTAGLVARGSAELAAGVAGASAASKGVAARSAKRHRGKNNGDMAVDE
jgi:hypothetical protein